MQGTLGVLVAPNKKWWYSLELPWLANKQGISCIPIGTYKVLWTKSPRFGKYTYEIINVPGRGGIRMHSGTWAGVKPKYKSHSLGCPLIGNKVGQVSGQLAVLNSRISVAQFEREMEKKSFILEITNGNA